MTATEMVTLWEAKGKPPIYLGWTNDAAVIHDLRKFLEAGPGPTPQNETEYNRALATAETQLRRES